MFTIHLKAILHIQPKQVAELGERGGGCGGFGSRKQKKKKGEKTTTKKPSQY